MKIAEQISKAIDRKVYGDEQIDLTTEHTKQTALAFGRLVQVLAEKGLLDDRDIRYIAGES